MQHSIKLDLTKIHNINSFADDIITQTDNEYYVKINSEDLCNLKYHILSNNTIEFYSDNIILLTKLNLVKYHDNNYYNCLIEDIFVKNNIMNEYENVYFIYKL